MTLHYTFTTIAVGSSAGGVDSDDWEQRLLGTIDQYCALSCQQYGLCFVKGRFITH